MPKLRNPISGSVINVPDATAARFPTYKPADQGAGGGGSPPPGNASVEDWRAYAVSLGADEGDVADLTRDELRSRFSE